MPAFDVSVLLHPVCIVLAVWSTVNLTTGQFPMNQGHRDI